MDVVVLNKRASQITVVIGKGVYNVQCDLFPTKNDQIYVGSIMGRELINHRKRELVQADLDLVNPVLKKSRVFKK